MVAGLAESIQADSALTPETLALDRALAGKGRSLQLRMSLASTSTRTEWGQRGPSEQSVQSRRSLPSSETAVIGRARDARATADRLVISPSRYSGAREVRTEKTMEMWVPGKRGRRTGLRNSFSLSSVALSHGFSPYRFLHELPNKKNSSLLSRF